MAFFFTWVVFEVPAGCAVEKQLQLAQHKEE